MSGNLNINVTNVEVAVAREPIPMNGWFKMVITDSEVVPGKKDPENCRRLNLQLKVVEGQYKNRPVNTGLNIQHTSPITQEIAMKELSAIGHAVGVLVIQDSSQLHNIPMWVKIKLVPPTGEYEEKNEVVGYKHSSEQVDPPKPAVSTGPTSGPAATQSAPAFVPPTAFVPPSAATAPAVAQAPAWTPPAAVAPVAQPAVQQAWAPAAETAPVAQPLQQAAPVLQAPAQTAPAPVFAAPAAPVQAVAQPAVSPATGLAIPPWAVPAQPAA